jgi:predicted dehydrogenase
MSEGVAIVGCGLIGNKRARALGDARLIACADFDRARAEALARTSPGALSTTDWREAVTHPEVTVVVVATANDALATVSRAALEAGKHVLVEKPAARSVAEIEPVLEAAVPCGSGSTTGTTQPSRKPKPWWTAASPGS